VSELLRNSLIAALSKRAEIKLTCEPETEAIEGNASAIGPKEDAETNQWIRDQLNAGNEWAWCVATVTVNYKGFSAFDTLGACSYKSEDDFRKDGYFTDMVNQASAELADKLIAASTAITELLTPMKLECAGGDTCTKVITHIDHKGWTYCTSHGKQRQIYVPCRKLTATEIAKLECGETIPYRRKR